MQDIGARRKAAVEAFNEQNETLRHVLQALKKLEQDASGLKGEIRSADRRIKQAEQNQKDGDLLVSQYGEMTLQEIEDIQKEELDSKKGHLAALKSAAQAEIRLEQIQKKKQELERKLESLRERESKQHWQLQNQLDEATAAPLRAVDPRLVMASPGQDLDADSKAAIEAFARLFVPNDLSLIHI